MKKLLSLLAVVTLLGFGCTGVTVTTESEPMAIGPLTFTFGGNVGSVLSGESVADGYFVAPDSDRPDGTACSALNDVFPGATAYDYEFVLNEYSGGENDVGHGWSVYLLPNTVPLMSMGDLEAQFTACGITMWTPTLMTPNYILVAQNCEGVASCMDARVAVEGTLRLE